MFRRNKQWSRTLAFFYSAGVLVLLSIAVLFYVRTIAIPVPHEGQVTVSSPSFFRALDGIGVGSREAAHLRPFAVIIDNSVDARPLSGIAEARLVFETIAEGSITRLLAIFDPLSLPSRIGPVRSLRPYFLTWAEEVNAVIAHVGGSPEALERVELYDNLNQFYDDDFFWRDLKRKAPHNVYTSGERLQKGMAAKQYATTTAVRMWNYERDVPAAQHDAAVSEIGIDFSLDPYFVTWLYDAEENKYHRFVNHVRQNVSSRNIIVQVVPARVIDAELRRRLSLVGEGRAWVFNGGNVIIGTWKKERGQARTLFYDENGNEITFSPGITWVEVIDDEGRVRF